jgi:hypothetical protein
MIQLTQAVSTADTIRYINPFDDAIDFTASNIEAYAETFDERHIKLQAGRVPTYFIMRPCSQAEVRRASTAVAARQPDLTMRVGAIGGELLLSSLIGAENLVAAGDSYRWPQGCPPGLLDAGVTLGGVAGVVIDARIQQMLAVVAYRLAYGLPRDGSLADEGKSPSPSSSNEGGTSTAQGSGAATAKKTKGSAGGAAARARRS